MVFEVLGHFFATIEALFDFGVSYVAADDDCAVERQTCRHGIFRQFGENFGHRAVKVDFDDFALALTAIFFGNEFAGVGVEFFDPQTFAVDFSLHVAVGRAADAEANGAGCAVARKTYDADVVSKIFAAELGAETEFFGCFFQLSLKLDVAESVAEFVAFGGQRVVVFDRCFFDGLEVFLGRCSADDKGDVVGRTCGSA